MSLQGSPIHAWPFLAQFAAFLVLADFLQWCIHNLLHRVPWLWTFHKVHHSITTMDWIGNWHFHWMEIVVYKSAPVASARLVGRFARSGFRGGCRDDRVGDFNHANVDAGLGPLGYVFNSPRMHLWHHDHSSEGGAAKNFGVVFSLWDYAFGTAFWPHERVPEQLGYPGMEEMPATLHGQVLWPAIALTRPSRRHDGPDAPSGDGGHPVVRDRFVHALGDGSRRVPPTLGIVHGPGRGDGTNGPSPRQSPP